jgi:hypothetical protein
MELVKGIRITDYCDQNNLSTTERLGLFMQVCHAIQHAHQKGIIHRDIQPSKAWGRVPPGLWAKAVAIFTKRWVRRRSPSSAGPNSQCAHWAGGNKVEVVMRSRRLGTEVRRP